jgi:hypothetical protein
MQDLIIFDLDDTLALTAHRTHFLLNNPPDWQAYYAACPQDSVFEPVAAIFYDHFVASRDMWIVSARSDLVREKTEDWLFMHGIYYSHLLMKSSDDIRPNADIKMRWLHDGTIPRERVLCAYDNELPVVNMYRAEGITCFHVLPGEADAQGFRVP